MFFLVIGSSEKEVGHERSNLNPAPEAMSALNCS